MSAKKRLAVVLGAVALVTAMGSRPSAAQGWYPPPYRYAIDPDSAVRLQIKPRDAEVFVDGYYAGITDDFDGVFQRLRTAPGGHEITIYLRGYRTLTERVYLRPNATLTIKREMERLAPGEVSTPPPTPAEPVAGEQAGPPPQPRGPFGPGRRVPPPQPPYNQPPYNEPPPSPGPSQPGQARQPGQAGQSGQAASGTLSLRVQPGDAEVLIDGTPWRAPQGSEPLVVDLPEGHHTVQVRKAGYISYLTDTQVRRGETTGLNVSLRPQP